MTSYPASLNRLWAMTGQVLRNEGAAYNTYFDGIGLLLSAPLKPSQYDWCAPTNVLTFGETGGDGVQFSFLPLDGKLSEDSPIVMTVPMAMEDRTNFVVGENLRDFLALGCRRGYFFLEQLAYKPDWLLSELADTNFSEEVSHDERDMLVAIGDAFGLSPWGESVADRLKWLQTVYCPLLAMPAKS